MSDPSRVVINLRSGRGDMERRESCLTSGVRGTIACGLESNESQSDAILVRVLEVRK